MKTNQKNQKIISKKSQYFTNFSKVEFFLNLAKKIRLKSDFFFFSIFSLFWRILLLLFFFPNFLSYITEWQTKFSEKVADLVVEKKMDRKYEINAFSSSYTNEILRQFSEVDYVQLAIGGMLMVIIIIFDILKVKYLKWDVPTCLVQRMTEAVFLTLGRSRSSHSKKLGLRPNA